MVTLERDMYAISLRYSKKYKLKAKIQTTGLKTCNQLGLISKISSPGLCNFDVLMLLVVPKTRLLLYVRSHGSPIG